MKTGRDAVNDLSDKIKKLEAEIPYFLTPKPDEEGEPVTERNEAPEDKQVRPVEPLSRPYLSPYLTPYLADKQVRPVEPLSRPYSDNHRGLCHSALPEPYRNSITKLLGANISH